MAPSHIAILIPLIVGLAATIATIAIHGVVLHTIIMSLRRDLKRGRAWLADLGQHVIHHGHGHARARRPSRGDRALGARARSTGAVADIGAAIYSSAGSYTTSGSDIALPPQWRLLGPFEAVDGMLMFGVSTAFIFAVVNRLIMHGTTTRTSTFFEALSPASFIPPPAGPPHIVSRYSRRPAP